MHLRLTLACAGSGCTGSLLDEKSGTSDPIDAVRSLPGGRIVFRRQSAAGWSWFHTSFVDGVLAGRFSTSADHAEEPASPLEFAAHVTGWKAEYFDRSLSPRVFDLVVDNRQFARVRIDHSVTQPGAFEARYKAYATWNRKASDEQDEYVATVEHWDGRRLAFTVTDPSWTRGFDGIVDGRNITGMVADSGMNGGDPRQLPFRGSRAEILTHGFLPRPPDQRGAWQQRTRRALLHLMMADGPAPLSSRVTELQTGLAPFASTSPSIDRDDRSIPGAGDYTMRELRFESTLPDPARSSSTLVRVEHGFFSLPTTSAPANGFPVVIALNGHEGSARTTMNPDSEFYWYGDSFARHGFAVLALDVGHRPIADRRGLYLGVPDGDEPAYGNGLHPAIQSPGLDSDWEEGGERVWDVMRAIDWLKTQPGVDPKRIAIAGLSMGGEVATWAAALDSRIGAVVAAGFSPDLSVLLYHGSHGCWQWANSDLRSWIDASDLHAMIAPRTLVVETGKQDWTYSWLPQPYAADKQVLRRSRAAFADHPDRLLHYLHYDLHHFHMGGPASSPVADAWVRTPMAIAPSDGADLQWQRDGSTLDLGKTVFDALVKQAK